MKPGLIAIAGGSGAGKTWLAELLQKRFGARLSCFSLDHFYRDRSQLPEARRSRINYDHPRAIDWELFEAVLDACRCGRPARLPKYDFSTHQRLDATEPWIPTPLVVVEGLWVFRPQALRRAFNLKIFMECPDYLRLQRRIDRDIRERGRREIDVRRQFRLTVAPMHDRYIAPQRKWADFIIESPPRREELNIIFSSVELLFQEGME